MRIVCSKAGHSESERLQILSAAMGLGMSSIYATSLLWCERYIALTNSVTALFTLFGMAAANVLQGTIIFT